MNSHETKNRAAVRRENLLATAFNKTLIFRTVFAAVLFVVAVIAKQEPIFTILLVFSAIIAVCDLVYNAVQQIKNHEFLNSSLLVLFTGIAAFIISFKTEAVIMLILYQCGRFIISKIELRQRKFFFQSVPEGECRTALTDVIKNPLSAELSIKEGLIKTFNPLLLAIIVLALLYLIILPFAANYNFTITLHRALIMILIASPASMYESITTIGLNGLCLAAKNGKVFSSAKALEINDQESIVYDSNRESGINMYSDVMQRDSFINFIIHVVCNSQQNFAKVLINKFNFDFDASLIQDFEDIEGLGVKGSINGMQLIFGTPELLKYENISVFPDFEHFSMHLYLGGRYIGSVEFIESGIQNNINEISRRVDAIAIENVVFTFIVKGILFFLAFLGFINLWFAVVIDIIVSLAGILNSNRVNSRSKFDLIFLEFFN